MINKHNSSSKKSKVVKLFCEFCKPASNGSLNRNPRINKIYFYSINKNSKNNEKKLFLSKYCKACKQHTLHK